MYNFTIYYYWHRARKHPTTSFNFFEESVGWERYDTNREERWVDNKWKKREEAGRSGSRWERGRRWERRRQEEKEEKGEKRGREEEGDKKGQALPSAAALIFCL